MTHRRHRAAVALAAGALLAIPAACGNDDQGGSDVTTVSGNCALMHDKYTLSPVSTDRLESALGPGVYTAEGSVSSDDRSDTTRAIPLNGECNYLDDDGVRRLSVSVSEKGLPGSSYDDARRTQQSDSRAKAIDGADGYVITEDVKDNDGSTAKQAVAVVFEGKRIVIANILVPAKGVDSGTEAVAVAKEALGVFDRRMQGAS
jgi:hypothetical protein